MSLIVTEIYKSNPETELKLPLFLSKVKAGFPSPADDYIEKPLDINELLVKHPAVTFFVRVKGDSMIKAGIYSGDLLVVDRSLKAMDKKIIIAYINGEMTVKRFRLIEGKPFLYPENDEYQPIALNEDMDFIAWGVVTAVIHPLSGDI